MRPELHRTIRNRRSVLGLVMLGAPAMLLASPSANATPTKIYHMTVHRDPNCGCCGAWTKLIEASGRFKATLKDEPDMPALKGRLGVPQDLTSCHTAQVEGLLIEGHVPAKDVLRLLISRPANILGLAVVGMPMGSPGMEQPGGRREAFDVFSFNKKGARQVFARYAAI